MYAISFEQMPDRKPRPAKHRLHPDPAWLAQLTELWRRAVATGKLPPPRAKSTASRARNASSSSVSYDAIARTRADVLTAFPDAPLPQPYATVRDQAEWDWIDTGRRLRASNGVLFAAILRDLIDTATMREAEAEMRAARENAERRLREKVTPPAK